MRVATDKRLGQTVSGMLLTIGCGLGLVLIIAFFTFSPSDPRITQVDYMPTVLAARDTGAFKVAFPSSVPDGWTATSVRYRPSATDPTIATWHLGFYVPEDDFVGLEQTNGADPDFIRESTAKGKQEGTEEIDGVTWARYLSGETGHRSLVSKQGDLTTVVTGTLSYEQLSIFAQSLRTT